MEKEKHHHRILNGTHISPSLLVLAGLAIVVASALGAVMVGKSRLALKPQYSEAGWLNSGATGCAAPKSPFERARCEGAGGSSGGGSGSDVGSVPECNPVVRVVSSRQTFGQGRLAIINATASASANCLIEYIRSNDEVKYFSGTPGPISVSFGVAANDPVGTCKPFTVTIGGRKLSSTGVLKGTFTGSGTAWIGVVAPNAPSTAPNPCTQ